MEKNKRKGIGNLGAMEGSLRLFIEKVIYKNEVREQCRYLQEVHS